MSEEKPITTHPLSENEKLLQRKFYEDFTAQSERVDKLSAQLLNLELAIPGIYASVLKLVSGEKTTLVNISAIWLTFSFWGIALALTVGALIPKKYDVNPYIFRQAKNQMDNEIGIEDYFSKSAERKRYFAIASIGFFFVGIMIAAFTISAP